MRKKLVFTLIVLASLWMIPTEAVEESEELLPTPEELEEAFSYKEAEEEADNPVVQEALHRLESESLAEKSDGVQKIKELLSDPQRANVSPYDQTRLHHALSIVGGASFSELLPSAAAELWENGPLNAEQELALESGQTLDLQSIGQGLTERELRALERYIVDFGKSVDTVYFSRSVLEPPVMGIGPVYEENQRTFLKNRRVMKERIRAEVERAIPTYQNLTSEQKAQLVNTLFDRSTRIGYVIRRQINIRPEDIDAEGQLKPEAIPALQTAIHQALATDIKIDPSDVELKPTQLTRPQAQELNTAVEQIRALKEHVASAALQAPFPLKDRYFLNDPRYAEYHLGKSLIGFFANLEQSLTQSLAETKSNIKLKEYKEFIKGVSKEILDQSSFSDKDTYAQQLAAVDSAQSVEDLLRLVQQSKSNITTRTGALGETFGKDYQDQLIPFSNLIQVAQDSGTFIGAENSAQAFQKLTTEYFKDHKDSPMYREIVNLGLQSSHPNVQTQAIHEIAIHDQGENQRKTLSHFLNSREEVDFKAEIKRICAGSPSFTRTAFDALATNVRREIPEGHTKSNHSQAAAALGQYLNHYMTAYQESPAKCAAASQLANHMAQTIGNTFVDELTPYKRQLTGQFAKMCEDIKNAEIRDPLCKTLTQNALRIPAEYNNEHDRALYAEGKVLACAEDTQVTIGDTSIYCEDNPSYGNTNISQIHDDVRGLAQFQNPNKSPEAQLRLRSEYLKTMREKMVDALRQNLVSAAPYVDGGRLQQGVTALQNLGNRCAIASSEHIQKIAAVKFTERDQKIDIYLKQLLNVDENGVIHPFDDSQNNVIQYFSDFAALQSIVDSSNPEEPLNKAYFYGGFGTQLSEEELTKRQALLAKDLEKRKKLASGPHAFLMDPIFRAGPHFETQFYGQVIAFYTAGLSKNIHEMKPQRTRVYGNTESFGRRELSADMPNYEGLKQGLQAKFNEHYDSILKELFRYCDTMGCEALDGTYAPDIGEERTKAIVEASPILKTFFGESIEDIMAKNPQGKCIQGKTSEAEADRTAAVMLLMNNQNLRKAVLDDHPEYADIDCELQNDVKNLTPHFPITQTVVAVSDMTATVAATIGAAYFGGALGAAAVGGALGGIYTADAYQNWNKAELAAQETEAALRAHGMESYQLRGTTMDQLMQSYTNVTDAANMFYLAAATSAVFDVGTAGLAIGRGASRARNLSHSMKELRAAPKGSALRTSFEKFVENPRSAPLIEKYGSQELAFLAAHHGEKVITGKMALRAGREARQTAKAAKRKAITETGGWGKYYKQKMGKAITSGAEVSRDKAARFKHWVTNLPPRNIENAREGDFIRIKIPGQKPIRGHFVGKDAEGNILVRGFKKGAPQQTVPKEGAAFEVFAPRYVGRAERKALEKIRAARAKAAEQAPPTVPPEVPATTKFKEIPLRGAEEVSEGQPFAIRRTDDVFIRGNFIGEDEKYIYYHDSLGDILGKPAQIPKSDIQSMVRLGVSVDEFVATAHRGQRFEVTSIRGNRREGIFIRADKDYIEYVDSTGNRDRLRRNQLESMEALEEAPMPAFPERKIPPLVQKQMGGGIKKKIMPDDTIEGTLQDGVTPVRGQAKGIRSSDGKLVLIDQEGREIAVDPMALDWKTLKISQEAIQPPALVPRKPAQVPISPKVVDSNVDKLSGSEYSNVAAAESIGGTAGPNRLTVNGYVDRETGEIIAFGNIQDVPRQIRENPQFAEVYFLQDARTEEILRVGVRSKSSLTDEALANLQGAVAKYNRVRAKAGPIEVPVLSEKPLAPKVTPSLRSRESGKLFIPGKEDFKALGQRIKTGFQKLKEKIVGKKSPLETAARPTLGAKFTKDKKTWQVVDIDDEGFVLGRGRERIRYDSNRQRAFEKAFKRDTKAQPPLLEGDIRVPEELASHIGRDKVTVGEVIDATTPAGNKIKGPLVGISDDGKIVYVQQGEGKYPLEIKKIKTASIEGVEPPAPKPLAPEPVAPASGPSRALPPEGEVPAAPPTVTTTTTVEEAPTIFPVTAEMQPLGPDRAVAIAGGKRVWVDEEIKVILPDSAEPQTIFITGIRKEDGKALVLKATPEGDLVEEAVDPNFIKLYEEPRVSRAPPARAPPVSARQSTLEELERVKAQATELGGEEAGSQVKVYIHPDGKRVIKEYRPTAFTSHKQVQKVRQRTEELGYGHLLATVDEEFADPHTGRVLAYTQEKVTPLSQWKGAKPDVSGIEEATAALRREGIDIEIKPQNLGVRSDGTVVFIDTDDVGDITRRLIRQQTKRTPFSPTPTLQETKSLKPGDIIYFTYKDKSGAIKKQKLGILLSLDEVPLGPRARASAEEMDLLFMRFENGTLSRMGRPYAESLTRQPYIEVVSKAQRQAIAQAPTPTVPTPVPSSKPITPAQRSADILLDNCTQRLKDEDCLHLHAYFSAVPEEDTWGNRALEAMTSWAQRGGELTPSERYVLSKALKTRKAAEEVEHVLDVIGVKDPTEPWTSAKSLSDLRRQWKALKKSIKEIDGASSETKTFLLEDLDETYADQFRNMALRKLTKLDDAIALRNEWKSFGEYIAGIPNPQTRQRLTNVINPFYRHRLLTTGKKALGADTYAYDAFQKLVSYSPSGAVRTPAASVPHMNLAVALFEGNFRMGARPLSQKEVFEIFYHLAKNPDGYDRVLQGTLRTLAEDPDTIIGHIYQAHVGTKFARSPKKIVTRVVYEPPVLEGQADMLFQYWNGKNALVETKAGLASLEKTSKGGQRLQKQLERYAKVLQDDIPVEGVPIHQVEIHFPGPKGSHQPWIQEEIDRLNTALPPDKKILIEVTP